MELELHSLNAMRSMEVIDIDTGSKMGFIKDFKIDCNTNKIISLILPGEIKSWFGKEEEIGIEIISYLNRNNLHLTTLPLYLKKK